MKRIGFCCKFVKNSPLDSVPTHNTRSTTCSWIRGKSAAVSSEKLWEITKHNLQSVKLLISETLRMHHSAKMVRLSSDLLPCYTAPEAKFFWSDTTVQKFLEVEFAKIGDYARANDVRLSFHPGQFCVLASDKEEVVNNSIAEFEYHAMMARMMGYGQTWHDHGFKINVHIAGRAGPAGFLATLSRLSPEARNLITIENEEISYGLADCLSISHAVPVVLDIHHHWVREGRYFSPATTNTDIDKIIDSWRGCRPVMHFSVSRDTIAKCVTPRALPNHSVLLNAGFTKQALRAHSEYYWCEPVNRWALSFLDRFDIQCEAKAKNLASSKLIEFAVANSFI